jgi:CPA1 family monovalent cation:H+ antiporter
MGLFELVLALLFAGAVFTLWSERLGIPYLVVFSAFCVVLTTLVLQGLTLRPLLQRLCLDEDRTVEREIGIARAETARAALRALDDQPSAGLLRSEYQGLQVRSRRRRRNVRARRTGVLPHASAAPWPPSETCSPT